MNVIQIGANTGKDSVYDFLNDNKSDVELIILVEPIPFIIDELKSQYESFDNVIIENIAISDDEVTEFDIFYEDNSNYEVSSFSKTHLLDHGCPEYKIKTIKVPSLTINQLLEKHKIYELDYLFLDAEGLDVHIISKIDFTKFKIKNLIFEVAHTDGVNTRGENYHIIMNWLESLGYTMIKYDNLNVKASL